MLSVCQPEDIKNYDFNKNGSEAIAIINSEHEKNFICIHRNDSEDDECFSKIMMPKENRGIDEIGEDFFTSGRLGRKIKKPDLKLIDKSIREDLEPDDFEEFIVDQVAKELMDEYRGAHLADRYRKAYEVIARTIRFNAPTKGKYITLESGEGKIEPIPIARNPKFGKFRESLYITGPTGAGKSVYAAKYAEKWSKMFTTLDLNGIQTPGKVIRFSKIMEDSAFSRLDFVKTVKLDERMITDPITAEKLRGCLVIFDDIDTLPDMVDADKQIKMAVMKLRDDLLQTGRHENIYVINTTHQAMNWKSTRCIINEATSVTFFPSSGTTGSIVKFLSIYAGLSKQQIQKMLGLPSRWVTIYMNFPRYVLYENGCYIV